jgi:hypothetical protein
MENKPVTGGASRFPMFDRNHRRLKVGDKLFVKGGNMKSEVKDNSKRQAELQLESIRELVAAWRAVDRTDLEGSFEWDRKREEAERAIHNDALSVEVRSGWYQPGTLNAGSKPEEYTILLCTGGPACRIIGELDEYYQPKTAHIEHQDWGTPWTEYRISSEDEEILLEYARCFYFGD